MEKFDSIDLITRRNSPYANLDALLENFYLNKEYVLSVYPYGSRVYGTARPDSDYGMNWQLPF